MFYVNNFFANAMLFMHIHTWSGENELGFLLCTLQLSLENQCAEREKNTREFIVIDDKNVIHKQ